MSEYTSHWIVFSNFTDDKQEGILLRLELMGEDDFLPLHFTSNENSIPTIVDAVFYSTLNRILTCPNPMISKMIMIRYEFGLSSKPSR